MKKLFLTAAIISIVMASSANAACNGGTEYTIDGDVFCVSNIEINWWSAANWCKANGMRLATIYEACPNWSGNIGWNQCARTIGGFPNFMSWTATVNSDINAYATNLSDANLTYYSRTDLHNALCTN